MAQHDWTLTPTTRNTLTTADRPNPRTHRKSWTDQQIPAAHHPKCLIRTNQPTQNQSIHGSRLSSDAAEARRQILAAAESVIARYGVSKTTMDDIGKQAGVSRPTVYRYFGDRDNLLAALIERRARMLFDRARTYIFGFESFAEQLVEGLLYLIDHGRRDPIVRILVGPEYLGVTSPIVNGSALAAELTAEMWEPVLQQAIQRGQIRSDLDVLAVGQWLAMVQFIMVGRRDVTGPDDPGTREMLKRFVLPAFMPTG